MKKEVLIQKFTDDLTIRHFSPKTISVYQGHLKIFLNYFANSDFKKLSSDDIKRFLISLIHRKYSASYLKGVIGTMQNFYKYTLDIEWNYRNLPVPKIPKKLPIILSQQEVSKIIQICKNLKHKTILTVLYTTGVRISELLNLQVVDIDSQRMQILIRGGKGNKDRYVLLSKKCLTLLRRYWKEYRPKKWLFNGMKKNSQYSRSSTRKIIKRIAKSAGIKKNISCHTFRHSFATHMLENGMDIVLIKKLLGHSSIKTTMIYLKLRKMPDINFKHPFDNYITTS